MTEDEMVGWHHQLYGHEFEQTPGDSEGQGSLVCYNPWSHKLDKTQRLKYNNGLFSCEGLQLAIDKSQAIIMISLNC